MQTLLICLLIGSINENFWFSYILFLTFLGGILVIFIYITSLASNEIFNFSIKILLIIIIISVIILINFKINIISEILNLNNIFINFSSEINNKETIKTTIKLYNFPSNLNSILIINYLLFTLIVSVKITDFYHGPLRNLN